jgi:hypothetical protein
MKAHMLPISVLAGGLCVFALSAAERPGQIKSDDSKKVKKVSEEELERTLATLADRCDKMLGMQLDVYNGTKDLHAVIEGNGDKKPRPEDMKVSLKLADKIKDLAEEATKAADQLEAETAAVAFPEFFRELRKDMERVQDCLKKSDVGSETQGIEMDIIQSLREMIAALKKG